MCEENLEYKNVFLHFLNYDTQTIFNIEERYLTKEIEKQILLGIYISILISEEYTFLPFGFPYETELTYKILLQLSSLRREGLIRYAGKELDLHSFIEKKRGGYEPYKKIADL